MSTHATIGVEYPDGKISGCYVHYDGSTIKDRLIDFLKTNTTTGLALLIARAQGCGGIRSFHVPEYGEPYPLTDKSKTSFLDDDEPTVVNELNWKDQYNESGATYSYLVNYKTEEIKVWRKYNG